MLDFSIGTKSSNLNRRLVAVAALFRETALPVAVLAWLAVSGAPGSGSAGETPIVSHLAPPLSDIALTGAPKAIVFDNSSVPPSSKQRTPPPKRRSRLGRRRSSQPCWLLLPRTTSSRHRLSRRPKRRRRAQKTKTRSWASARPKFLISAWLWMPALTTISGLSTNERPRKIPSDSRSRERLP